MTHRYIAATMAAIGLTLTGASAYQPAASAGPGFVHTAGRQVFDGNGQPLQLRGVAIGNWLLWENFLMDGQDPPSNTGETVQLQRLAALVGQSSADSWQQQVQTDYVTSADLQQIAARGLNTVRVPINYRVLSDPSGWTYLDNVTGWARAAGLYVILDLHATPGSQSVNWTSDPVPRATNALSGSKAFQDQTVTVWQTIAGRYADDPTVAGYDLINEPEPFGQTAKLNALYRRIAAAIRQVDPNHMLIVEGTNYDDTLSSLTGLPDPNTMLELHLYWSKEPNPVKVLTNAENNAASLGAPLWIGEFGLDTNANVAAQISRYDMDPIVVGWSFWTWKSSIQSNGARFPFELQVSPAWLKLAKFLANTSNPRPTVAQARQGMDDYLSAIRTPTADQELLAALS
jgi:aryl-phospho-beta-D-glucosidase BglC (GH1 family)